MYALRRHEDRLHGDTEARAIQLDDAGVNVDGYAKTSISSAGFDVNVSVGNDGMGPVGEQSEHKRRSSVVYSAYRPIAGKQPRRKHCFTIAAISCLIGAVIIGIVVGLVMNSPSKWTTMPLVDEPWHEPFLPPYAEPVLYDVWLYPDFYLNGKTFSGRENITIVLRQDTNLLLVHCKQMDITDVQVSMSTGRSLQVDTHFLFPKNQYLVVQTKETMPNGSTVILHFEFRGSLAGINGYYKSTYVNRLTGNESWLTVTHFQPTEARGAFPCFDEPKYKANFNVTLKHWTNFTAHSNMPAKNSVKLDEDFSETSFEPTVVMSTYLLCFIVCDFKNISGSLKNGKPHAVWARPDKINQAHYALEVSRTVVDYYEREFDMAYQLPKLDHFAIPDYNAGATEHWGIITYRETLLLYDEDNVGSRDKGNVASLMSHELAHNYFGNIITNYWWNDIWLQEGFADFYAYKAADIVVPELHMQERFLVAVQQLAMCEDAGTHSRVVISDVTDPHDIKGNFDIISYKKGASILRMLEDLLGKDHFRNGVRTWLHTHAFSTVTSDGFWDVLQEESPDGVDIGDVMRPWFEQMGLPVVDIAFVRSHVQVTQTRFLDNPDADRSQPPAKYNYKWDLPLTYLTSSGSKGQTWLRRSDDTVTIPADTKWLKLNRDQVGFYRVNYPAATWRALAEQLENDHNVFSVMDRTGLLDDAFKLAAAGLLHYPTVLELLSYLQTERDYTPWRGVVTNLKHISSLFYNTTDEQRWRSFVVRTTSGIMKHLGVNDTGSELDKELRSDMITLACDNGNVECLDNVLDVFNRWLLDPVARPVSSNLRLAVYSYGMRQRMDEGAFNTMWQRYQTATSGQDKTVIIRAIAQTQNISHVHRYLEMIKEEEGVVRRQDFCHAVAYLAFNPFARPIAWEWMKDHYEELVKRFGLGNYLFSRLVPYVSQQGSEKSDLIEAEDFFERYPKAGSGKNKRKTALATIKRNIAWKKKHIKTIVTWLKLHL